VNETEFRRASRNVWEKMADGWDSNRNYMWESSKPVGEWLVEKLEPARGHNVLELAAGIGDTGFIAANLVGNEGKLLSTDFAPSMVRGARRRAAELGIDNAEFRVMDAERMDLDSDRFDGVLCRWGLMLMADPAAALRESHRVLKSGGRICFSVFSTAEKNPWAALPARALIEKGLMEAPKSGSPGILSLADRERVRQLVCDAGFDEPVIEEVPITWRHADFDRYWEFITQVAGAIAAILEALPPEGLEVARKSIEEAVAPFREGQEISFPGVTLNVAARKPPAG